MIYFEDPLKMGEAGQTRLAPPCYGAGIIYGV